MPLSLAILLLIFCALLFVIWDVQRITRRREPDTPARVPLELLDFSNVTWLEFDEARTRHPTDDAA